MITSSFSQGGGGGGGGRSLRAKRNFARANSVHFFAIVLHDFNVRETS